MTEGFAVAEAGRRVLFQSRGRAVNPVLVPEDPPPRSGFAPKAKADLHEIWMAETRDDATAAFDQFVDKYTLSSSPGPPSVRCTSIAASTTTRLISFSVISNSLAPLRPGAFALK
jgi:hypothetical protein